MPKPGQLKKSKGEHFVFWLFILFITCNPFARIVAQSLHEEDVKKLPISIFKTEDLSLSFNTILNSKAYFKKQEKGAVSTKPNEVYWIEVDFKDNLDTLKTAVYWRLITPVFDKAYFYYVTGDSLKRESFGNFNRFENMVPIPHQPRLSFTKENLIDGRYLYIKARMFSNYFNIASWNIGYISGRSNQAFNNYYSFKDVKIVTYDSLYLGACTILFLTFFAIFFHVKQQEFLFYSLYIVASIIYLLRPSFNSADITALYGTYVGHWASVICQILINLFYVVFAMYYLNTKNSYPRLHKLMHTVVFTLVGIIAVDALAFFFQWYQLHLHILDFQRIIMTLFGLFAMIYLLQRAKDKLALFIVVGSFVYMLGALGYLFFENRYLMILGSIFEILIFSLGLAYKIKLEYEEKLLLQQEVSSKEITALRAQMNPHFIFNALSSIQNLILNNDRISALKYLSKFGNLTRGVLENSIDAKVTLSDEIKLLKSYLELESLRFDGIFNYKIEVADNVDEYAINIPLMLIQPFVENAIIHGLVNKKKGEKLLTVSFSKEENTIVCEIEDNGIGRIASGIINTLQKRENKSRGMEITEKRLKLLSQYDIEKSTIEIVDKYDENNSPIGTKVTIKIIEELNLTI